jgi:serine/threonine protein kinase
MAPEILNNQYYNYKADMWSLGVSLFEAVFGHTPFTGRDKDDLIVNVNKGLVKLPVDNEVSSECLDFIIKCLTFDPDLRLSIDHAMNHPFINNSAPKYMQNIIVYDIDKHEGLLRVSTDLLLAKK